MVSSDTAPARRVGDDDVPARPALDAARILDGGQPPLHLARGRARRRRRAPRCPPSPAPAARGRRAPATRRAPAARPGRGRRTPGGRAPCLPLRRPARGRSRRLSRARARPRWRRRAAGRRRSRRRPRARPPPPRWPRRRPAPPARGAGRPRRRRSPPGAVRSSTPSETRTTSSSGAIVADAVSRRRVEAVEPEDRAVAALERAQPALGVPDAAAADARSAATTATRTGRPTLARTALMKMSGTSSAQSASWMVDAAVGQVAAAAARRAVGAQRDRADGRGLRALADGVGHAEPAAVGHRAVVDPVAADVVGRQDRAGHLGALQARDPRRHEVLLELGGRAARAVPARAGQHVGVALGQLEGRRAARRQRLEVARRRRGEDEHAQRAPAQRQRHHRGSVRQRRAPARRPAAGRDLGPDQLRASRAVSGSPPSPVTRRSERPSRSAT